MFKIFTEVIFYNLYTLVLQFYLSNTQAVFSICWVVLGGVLLHGVYNLSLTQLAWEPLLQRVGRCGLLTPAVWSEPSLLLH